MGSLAKRIFVILAAVAFIAITGYCATQYNAVGNVSLSSSTVTGGFGLWQRTVAQLQTLTPTTTGQILACTNCNVNFTICVSSGSTAPYQWILSTGTACK